MTTQKIWPIVGMVIGVIVFTASAIWYSVQAGSEDSASQAPASTIESKKPETAPPAQVIPQGGIGIYMQNVRGVHMEDIKTSGFGTGVYINNSADITTKNVKASGPNNKKDDKDN